MLVACRLAGLSALEAQYGSDAEPAAISQLGGKLAYRTRIGNRRSTRRSCRSVATPKQALPPEKVLRLAWSLIVLDIKLDLLHQQET